MNFSSFGLDEPSPTWTGEDERSGVGGAGKVLPSIDKWDRCVPFEAEMLA
jgi:hypothetical protein